MWSPPCVETTVNESSFGAAKAMVHLASRGRDTDFNWVLGDVHTSLSPNRTSLALASALPMDRENKSEGGNLEESDRVTGSLMERLRLEL